ncbi:hypothetical protein [Streptococcus plurextorum]
MKTRLKVKKQVMNPATVIGVTAEMTDIRVMRREIGCHEQKK